jgi:ketopantoate reductase
LLARAGADVLLVGRSRPRIDAIARRGLAIENGGVQDTVVRLPATTDPADSPASI